MKHWNDFHVIERMYLEKPQHQRSHLESRPIEADGGKERLISPEPKGECEDGRTRHDGSENVLGGSGVLDLPRNRYVDCLLVSIFCFSKRRFSNQNEFFSALFNSAQDNLLCGSGWDNLAHEQANWVTRSTKNENSNSSNLESQKRQTARGEFLQSFLKQKGCASCMATLWAHCWFRKFFPLKWSAVLYGF